MRLVHLALGLALIISSCSKKDIGKGEEPNNLPATSHIDLSYGDDANQKLDLYLPENRNSSTRLLLIIHGGGWSGGDKSDFNSYITEFQRRLPGYALANVNYRLVSESGNFFPAQENDINSAVLFLKEKAAEFDISTNFILMGISAGAHLAMLQGYKHSTTIQPRGIVSFFGPVDLEKLYMNSDVGVPPAIQTIMNATLEINPTIFHDSSPVNFVTSTSAPTLLLHGDADLLVPIEQAYMMREKLSASGVPNELVVYPGQGHGWLGTDLADSFERVVTFVKGLEN